MLKRTIIILLPFIFPLGCLIFMYSSPNISGYYYSAVYGLTIVLTIVSWIYSSKKIKNKYIAISQFIPLYVLFYF